MNKVLAERAMSKMSKLSFDSLRTCLHELADEFDTVDHPSTAMIDRLYALNFTIILSAQGRGINFNEYCNLMFEITHHFCGIVTVD